MQLTDRDLEQLAIGCIHVMAAIPNIFVAQLLAEEQSEIGERFEFLREQYRQYLKALRQEMKNIIPKPE